MDIIQDSTILQRHSRETCDFCDKTFNNRFDSIIHNASHIIIPLIKQECYQCNTCLHYFASQEELDGHYETKHATLATNNHNKTKLKFEISNQLTYNDSNDSSLYINELESKKHETSYNDAITNLKEDIFSNFRNFNSIYNASIEPEKHKCIDNAIIKPEKHNNEIEIKHEFIKDEDLENDEGILLPEDDYHEKSNSIKSRLRFEGEDELDDNVILSDLVTDCKVNMFNEPINKMPGFKNLNSQGTETNSRTLLNGSNYHTQIALSNSTAQLKLNNNYNIQAVQTRNMQPVSNEDILRKYLICDSSLSNHENSRRMIDVTQPNNMLPVSNEDILRKYVICDSTLSNHENSRQMIDVTQPNMLEKFTVESNNPLTLIDDLEYGDFVVRNVQKVEQYDETDLLVNHIKKIDKRNVAELLEPVSDRLLEPVSDRLLVPVSNRRLVPVSNRPLEPVSDRLLVPVSDRLLVPVSDRLLVPISDRPLESVSDSLLEPVYNSVHYSELIKPGIFKCKYCSKPFPNRLLLVQHEPAHMRARRPRPVLCTYCDMYVAGRYPGLRRHLAREHPGASPPKKHATRVCHKCGLKFRQYARHVRNYHPRECRGCGKEYSENETTQLQRHLQSCTIQNVSSKMLNVCDICYSFVKMKMNLKYILMGTTEYLPGVRYPCSMCGKKYFELKTIKRVLYGTSAVNTVKATPRCCKKTENKRPMSNEERLKKFQNRLKQINLLNKF